MNGVIELDESSDSDGDCASETKLLPSAKYEKSENVRDISFKKEETTEEKIIMDDDDDTIRTNNGESVRNMFSMDPNDQFSFNLEDKLSDGIINDESILDDFDKEPATIEQDIVDQSSKRRTNSETGNDDDPTSSIPSNFSAVVGETENENEGDQHEDPKANEEDSEQAEAEGSASNEKLLKSEVSTSKTTDSTEFEGEDNEESETMAPKDREEGEKDGNDKNGGDNEITEKRPSSRESSTSTTSSSSERITIRSTSQLNQLVTSETDIKIKTEKSTISDRVEKPGLSILNPSQLGASENTSGENLLQSNNFSGDQMMNFMPSGMPSPAQCDVCETQFPDSVSLDEHRAVAGHYKCRYAAECAGFVFTTLTEFSTHQQTVHGLVPPSPVQQLAHQVQSIPMRYLDQPGMSNNYQPPPVYTNMSQPNRGLVPQMLGPGQNNVPIRQYNVPGSPRIGGVRSVQTAQQVNQMKRVVSPLQQPALRQVTPSKRRCVDNFSSRNGDTDCKVVSVQKPDNTDDVVAQLSKSITITARQETQKKNDTNAVANMLANRGITVSSVPNKANKNNPVAMLNLNSAVSLIPTNANSSQSRQNSGFAVPQSRMGGNRQSIPGQTSQTVDLTGPEAPRNRAINNRAANKFTCRICDRQFFNQEQLNQHMTIHRSGPMKKQLPYKCPNCSAQYPNQQALMQHRQVCRRDTVPSTNEMVIPIVDLKQPGALQRLQSVGITQMIPLNALGSQAANGTFGIPILSFSSDRVTNTNLANIGVSNILPVGPLRRLSHL